MQINVHLHIFIFLILVYQSISSYSWSQHFSLAFIVLYLKPCTQVTRDAKFEMLTIGCNRNFNILSF